MYRLQCKISWLALLCIPLVFCQCRKDESGTGQLRIELTDAPVDDANIRGVFVTIAEVSVGGEVWGGMQGKQTIDLLTLQHGGLHALGIADVSAGANKQVSIVLDLETDAEGNMPGCYVLTQDNIKHDLAIQASAQQTVGTSGSFTVMENMTTGIVVDFDLRKALRYDNAAKPGSDYAFTGNADMQGALRVVVKDRTGHIAGKCTNLLAPSDKIIVYAYAQGTFDRESEVSHPPDRQFPNAVTSAAVAANGDYRLSWLNEGSYEVVFASYMEGSGGKLSLAGTLDLSVAGGLALTSVPVGTGATVVVDVTVLGLLPL